MLYLMLYLLFGRVTCALAHGGEGATQHEGAIRDQRIDFFAEYSMLTGLLFEMKTFCGYPACSITGLILRLSSLGGTTVDHLLDQAMGNIGKLLLRPCILPI